MKSYKFLTIVGLMVMVGLILGAPIQTSSQQPDTTPHTDILSVQTATLAGPDGVAQALKKAETDKSIYPQPSWLKSYDAWKKRIQDDYGVSFGLSAYWLYQKANESLNDEDEGFGGIYRFQGSWVAFGRDTGHPGSLEWRIENRNEVGGYLSPSQLGGEIGAEALNTGFGYSDNFSTDISVLNWTQVLFDKRAGFAVGRLAFDVYLDAFMFQTFSRGFLNRAFLVNPTIGTTGIGALGAVAKGFVTENFLIGGQIYDGNAASGDFGFDTFEEHEWLKAVEFAWTPAMARYKTDRIQFTYWDKDEREKAGVPGPQACPARISTLCSKLKTNFKKLYFTKAAMRFDAVLSENGKIRKNTTTKRREKRR